MYFIRVSDGCGIDREAFDQGQFKAQGGFKRINQTFSGELETTLSEINAELWGDIG